MSSEDTFYVWYHCSNKKLYICVTSTPGWTEKRGDYLGFILHGSNGRLLVLTAGPGAPITPWGPTGPGGPYSKRQSG